MQYSDEIQTIVGQLDIFDGLDGQKLTVTTADGDEYLIASKKWIKRLNKYADENIDISFEGTIEHDPEEGMDVINIKSFKPAQEVEDDLPTLLSLNEDLKIKKDKSGKKALPDDDDLEPLDEDAPILLPWDEKTVDGDDGSDDDDGNEDEEPNPEDLDDEDIPDDIDLDELEEEPPPPEPPAKSAKGKKNKR
ncbi:MAG: hypothetical protein J5743_03140 [Victivallales bacterium]|nr:hypothetical protein [Victivallales bacterium]